MGYIYMDESGCLGFDFSKQKTSQYFLITFLYSPQKRPLDKVVRKTFKSMHRKTRIHHSGVLHANSELPQTRRKLLQTIGQNEQVQIMAVHIPKCKVYSELQENKDKLYNYITKILLDRVFAKQLIGEKESLTFIASRRETNKFMNENFMHYLYNENLAKHKISLNITIATPAQEKGLQVVDFLSWAMFRALEHEDASYKCLFEQRISEDAALFSRTETKWRNA